MSTHEESAERVEERRARIIDFMSRRDPSRLGMTGAVVHARLAYLFPDARRCNHDLAALLTQGRLVRSGVSGTRWVVVDGEPVPVAREVEITPAKRLVLDLVEQHGTTRAIIASAGGALTQSQVDHHLHTLVQAGLVERIEVGAYRLAVVAS